MRYPAPGHEQWDAERVRALRQRLGESQTAFAERLGTRQQTVSEWERAASRPRRMARKLLTQVAEEQGLYAAEPSGGESAERA